MTIKKAFKKQTKRTNILRNHVERCIKAFLVLKEDVSNLYCEMIILAKFMKRYQNEQKKIASEISYIKKELSNLKEK